MSQVVAIAAVAGNGVIGAAGDIPWRIPEDWQRFKALTTGQVLVMGRKTYDSIGRPLPDRATVVVSRDPEWSAAGVLVAGSVPEAITLAQGLGRSTVYVAGGGELYRAAWDRLDRLELTEVDQQPEGEVTFPPVAAEDWEETAREERTGYRFVSYRRRQERY